MKKIVDLTKIYFKLNKSSMMNMNLSGGANNIMMLAINAVVAVMVMVFSFKAGNMISVMGVEFTGMLIKTVFGVFSIVLLLMQIGKVISTFYLDADIETFLVMPYKPAEIVCAKFICVLIPCYGLVIAVMAPFLIGFGIGVGAEVMYWILMAVSLIVFPIAPLVYGGLIAILVMRLFKGMRNKNLITMIGTLAPIIFVAVYMLISMTSMQEMDVLDYGDLIASQAQAMDIVNNIFPSSKFLSEAIINRSCFPLLIGIAIIVAACAILMLAACQWYFTGVLWMRNGASSNKAMGDSELGKAMKVRSPKQVLIKKDLTTLFRTPAHIMQAVFTPLFMLIISVAISIMVAGEGEVSTAITGMVSSGLIMAVSTSVMFGLVTSSAVTAFAREGIDLPLLRQLPIGNDVIYKTKRDSSIILGFIQIIPCFIIILVGQLIKGAFEGVALAVMFFVVLWGLFLITVINVFMGSINPIIDWKTENAIYSGTIITRIPGFAIVVASQIGMIILYGLIADLVGGYYSLAIMAALMIAIIIVVDRILMKCCSNNINKM